MIKKLISCLLILAMVLSLAACVKDEEPETESPGYILTNYKALPDSITEISRCFLYGDKLYLCCWEENVDNLYVSCWDENAEKPNYYIATINTDGSNFQKLPMDLVGTDVLLDIAPDGQNGLWILCMSLPGERETIYTLCHFDSNYRLTAEVPLNNLLEENDALRFVGKDLSLKADQEGNLCIVARHGKTSCFLFDRDGNYLFTLRDNSDPNSVILTASGQFAVFSTSNGGWAYSLLPVDIGKKSWGEPIEIGTAANVFTGSDNSSYYLFDSSDFYRCSFDSDEREKLFNWSNLGLACGDTHVCQLPDGKFAVVAGTYNQTQLLTYEFCIVEPGEDNRTVLTMLSLQPEDSLLEAIAQFNKSNDEYRVELTSYFSKNEDVTYDDWNKAITKLNTELISGKVPDLMDLANMPADAYSRRGILEDLYPYLKNDSEINMGDYYENVFDALSIDGELPYVTSSVRVISIFADKEIVGTARGWTMNEFLSYKQSGQVKMEFFPPTLLLKTLIGADNSFVDWEKGTCSYDSEEFAGLLEMCYLQALPDVEWMDDDGAFVGQANCIYASLDSVIAVAYYNALLGGNANPIGIPNLSGDVMHILEPANKIGFSTACEHKDGAWAFVRSFLEPRLQESGWYFPYLKSSFEKITSAAIKGNTIWIGGMYGNEADMEDIELARELLSSANYCINSHQDLTDMILNMSSSYFASGEGAQEAASEIQSRARLYVGEHY